MKKYTAIEGFNPEAIKKSATCFEGLCLFIIAAVKYHESRATTTTGPKEADDPLKRFDLIKQSDITVSLSLEPLTC